MLVNRFDKGERKGTYSKLTHFAEVFVTFTPNTTAVLTHWLMKQFVDATAASQQCNNQTVVLPESVDTSIAFYVYYTKFT